MDFWNVLRAVADSIFGSSTRTSSPKTKDYPASSQKQEKPKPYTNKSDSLKVAQSPSPSSQSEFHQKSSAEASTSTVADAKSKTAKSRTQPPHISTPSNQETHYGISPGACTRIQVGAIDDEGLHCRCTPEFPNTGDSDLFIDLGIDFGTRYTKICFRDSDSNQTKIVTLDYGSPSMEQSLVPSQLAILEGGEILTGLTSLEWDNSQWPIVKFIDFIKMRLAYLDLPQEESWLKEINEINSSETIENLSAYFLSRLIIRSRNWIQVAYSDLFKNRPATWILKVGAPVEYWQGLTIDRFEKVLRLAWALSYTPSMQSGAMLDLQQLQHCITQVRQWIEKNPDYPFDCSAKPEIAAAVWSHIKASGSREGFFTFFDVGEGTTEGASFRFWRDRGEDKIDFYSGFVKPLGVAALSQRMADELSIEPKDIKKILNSWSSKSSSSKCLRFRQSLTRRELQQLVGTVVVRGCHRYRRVRPHMWSDEIGPKLGIFLSGGGSQLKFYRDAVTATYKDFDHERASIRPYDLRPLPLPKDLIMKNLGAKAFDRFAVAYGLTIPDGEFPQFDFPPDSDKVSLKINGPTPPDYSDTKDLC